MKIFTKPFTFLLQIAFSLALLMSNGQNLFAQGCAADFTGGCAPFILTISGDFDSDPGGLGPTDCPASLSLSDGVTTVSLPRIGSCQPGVEGNETYQIIPNGTAFNCNATAVTVMSGALTCNYAITGGTGVFNGGMAVLPVELINFKAFANEETVMLQWETISEINNDYFTLQRSKDGRSFKTLGEISGAGNSEERLRYIFMDKNPLEGNNYYRLMQTDFDGTVEYYDILAVDFAKDGQISVFPNPTQETVKIGVTSSLFNETADIIIQDMSGKVVLRTQRTLTDSFVEVNLSDLNNGMYVLTMTMGNKVFNKKIVKN